MPNPLSHPWTIFKAKLSQLLGLLALWALLSLLAGIVAAQFLQDELVVQAIGMGTALLLLIWWGILQWRQKERWLRDLQEFLFKNQMLPFSFDRIRGTLPWNVTLHQERLLGACSIEYRNLVEKAKASGATLEKYVGTSVTERASKGALASQLGGELRRVYVLFSDVRGFTRMTESLKPEETVEILNQIFTAMEKVITEHGGDINKYIGDAILAHFRRPYGQEGEAAKMVLRTACAMQERFEALNKSIQVAYSKPVKIGMGIGVTAGEAVQGNIGSANRMEFTLIGDSVNLASRLCGIAEGGQILANEEMAKAAVESFETLAMEPVRIKGKSDPQAVYQVMGERMGFTQFGA